MPAFSVTTSDTSTGGAPLPHQQHRNRTIEEYFETDSDEEHAAIIQDIAGSMNRHLFIPLTLHPLTTPKRDRFRTVHYKFACSGCPSLRY